MPWQQPREDFAVFLLSHGRPQWLADNTLRSLLDAGYTGRWYVVVDDEDPTLPSYVERWGDRVLTFTKDDTATDMADNGGSRGVIVYARNAVEEIAKDLGLCYYLQLDDDYTYFRHRWADGDTLRSATTRRFDEVVDAMIKFLGDADAVAVAFAQGGDFMGGAGAPILKDRVRRKAMNSIFSKVGRPPRFLGRINEDVNTYVYRGGLGDLFLTVADFALNQAQTQSTAGGMTDSYLAVGTYTKSFYTVMFAPSAVKISVLGRYNYRIHHAINWNAAVPKILSDRHRKSRG